ncbi:MAG: NAD(P)-binding oxidoreductase [Pseudomonadota bacterium]
MTKRVLIMGATSGIGKSAVDVALSRGKIARAFARGAADIAPRDGLELAPGDALVGADVADALQDVDAVVYALGIKESVAMLWQPVSLFSQSTQVLIEEMTTAGVKRLIVVTGFGAGRSKQAMSRIERLGHRAILGRPYADKDVQEDMIMQSQTDWTIARPVILTNNTRSAAYRVLREPHEWRNGLISRRAVAEYLIDAVDDAEDIRRDVVLVR